MEIFRYVLEWTFGMAFAYGAYWGCKQLFSMKFNQVTSIVFSFLLVSLICYLLAPYVVDFPIRWLIYFPLLIILGIYDVMKLSRPNL